MLVQGGNIKGEDDFEILPQPDDLITVHNADNGFNHFYKFYIEFCHEKYVAYDLFITKDNDFVIKDIFGRPSSTTLIQICSIGSQFRD